MPPYRRSRFWYARTASSRSRFRKSGHSVSVTQISAYAICHKRKLLTRRVEEIAEPLLVELVRRHSCHNRPPRRLDDLRAAAVIERDVEQHPGVLCRPLLGHLQLAPDVRSKLVVAS